MANSLSAFRSVRSAGNVRQTISTQICSLFLVNAFRKRAAIRGYSRDKTFLKLKAIISGNNEGFKDIIIEGQLSELKFIAYYIDG